MRRATFAAFFLLLTALGGIYAFEWLCCEIGGADPRGPLFLGGGRGHIVTAEMANSSRAMVERVAPPFEARASDGKVYRLDEERRRGPVVLTFVKDDCPCSQAAQPYFDRLCAAYPGARFLGVIDAGKKDATRWASRSKVAYPILLDPARRIIRDYGAENSAYVVLVDAEGRIRKHWPGYSSAMLRQLGSILAETTGSTEKTIDLKDAPEEPYSGCPFDTD